MSLRATTILAAALLCLAPVASQADLATYVQDFEGMVLADPAALSGDGWLVYGNVFSPDHTAWYYGYGPYPAPNGGNGFSALVSDQGGPLQGVQQLSIYNDYNNTTEHEAGNLVEANVYREQTVGAADVGKTCVFRFDAKHGVWPNPIRGTPTALAFIKTLNPNAGWAMTNFVTVDMTSVPETWAAYEIQLAIDASLAGQILQIGFASTATEFDPTVIFYDNISFFPDQAVPVGKTTWGALKSLYR